MTIEMTDDDIMMIYINEGQVARTKQRPPSINIDLDAEGRVLEIEILGVSETKPSELMAVITEVLQMPRNGVSH